MRRSKVGARRYLRCRLRTDEGARAEGAPTRACRYHEGVQSAQRAPLSAIIGGGASARLKGFAVSLSGTALKTDGVVLCNQPRTLDISARRGKRVERAPDNIVDEVLAALQDIVE